MKSFGKKGETFNYWFRFLALIELDPQLYYLYTLQKKPNAERSIGCWIMKIISWDIGHSSIILIIAFVIVNTYVYQEGYSEREFHFHRLRQQTALKQILKKYNYRISNQFGRLDQIELPNEKVLQGACFITCVRNGFQHLIQDTHCSRKMKQNNPKSRG